MSWIGFDRVLQDENEEHLDAFICFVNLFFFHFMSSYISTSRNHTYIINLRHTQSSDAALLGLMVMCFMNVPCCGCVSQTERLTNCSILLNVRVMEAINGSELIAVTHLAPCHCTPPFTTCPEDLVLSRCLIMDRLFGVCGQMISNWTVGKSILCSVVC